MKVAVLKAVDDLDLRPTTLSADFTDRPACVINFLGLAVPSKIKHGSGAISKHLSLNDEYHQMCDMTALPSVMKQCVSGLRGRQPIYVHV
jgi:hypothetical protein